MSKLENGNLQATGCSRKAGELERPDTTPAVGVSIGTAANYNHLQVGGTKDCLVVRQAMWAHQPPSASGLIWQRKASAGLAGNEARLPNVFAWRR